MPVEDTTAIGKVGNAAERLGSQEDDLRGLHGHLSARADGHS